MSPPFIFDFYNRLSVTVCPSWILIVIGSVALVGCASESAPYPIRTYPDVERVAWSYPVSGDFMNAVQPHVDGDRAYVAADSLLRCVDVATGRPCWTRPLGVHRSLGARAVRADSARLYLNHFDTVWAVEKATGRVAWRTTVDDFSGVDLQHLAMNATHLLLGGVGEVVRIRKADGGIDWRHTLAPADDTAPEPFVFAPTLAPDGTLFVPTFFRRDNGRFFEGGVRAFDASGTRQWAFRVDNRTYETPDGGTYTAGGGVHGTALAGDRLVYAVGQSVVAVDRATGDRVWEHFTRTYGYGIGPTVAGDRVWIGSTTGRLFALDGATGQTQWHADLTGGILAAAAPDDDVVYQIDDGYGELWALDAKTGAVRWHGYPPEHTSDADATYRTPPGVGETHLVVVGSKRVYGLVKE